MNYLHRGLNDEMSISCKPTKYIERMVCFSQKFSSLNWSCEVLVAYTTCILACSPFLKVWVGSSFSFCSYYYEIFSTRRKTGFSVLPSLSVIFVSVHGAWPVYPMLKTESTWNSIVLHSEECVLFQDHSLGTCEKACLLFLLPNNASYWMKACIVHHIAPGTCNGEGQIPEGLCGSRNSTCSRFQWTLDTASLDSPLHPSRIFGKKDSIHWHFGSCDSESSQGAIRWGQCICWLLTEHGRGIKLR